MGGLSLSWDRRKADPYFRELYFVGVGLDIGAAGDPLLARWQADREAFPRIEAMHEWDLDTHGDATWIDRASTYDFIHASHVLEHMEHPEAALWSWLRALVPNGHLVVLVPEFMMYERGIWPPHVNTDHRTIWTLGGERYRHAGVRAWQPQDLITSHEVHGHADLVSWRYLNLGFNENLPVTQDQTVSPGVECAIEFVLRKRA